VLMIDYDDLKKFIAPAPDYNERSRIHSTQHIMALD